MEHYKIVLTIGGNTIEISSHEKAWVEEKEKKFLDFLQRDKLKKIDENNAKVIVAKEKVIHQDSRRQIPLNEFYRKYIHAKKIISRPDIATYFVYYLSKIEKRDEITATDIKNSFKEAQYPSWNSINIADVLNKAKRKAFLNCVSNRWTLTITGEDFILNNITE